MISQFSFYTFKFGSPILSFLLCFQLSPFLSLSLFISGYPGSSQDPCKEHVSHDTTATNAINKLSNNRVQRARVCTVIRAHQTVNRDWDIQRDIKFGVRFTEQTAVYYKTWEIKRKTSEIILCIRIRFRQFIFLHYELAYVAHSPHILITNDVSRHPNPILLKANSHYYTMQFVCCF